MCYFWDISLRRHACRQKVQAGMYSSFACICVCFPRLPTLFFQPMIFSMLFICIQFFVKKSSCFRALLGCFLVFLLLFILLAYFCDRFLRFFRSTMAYFFVIVCTRRRAAPKECLYKDDPTVYQGPLKDRKDFEESYFGAMWKAPAISLRAARMRQTAMYLYHDNRRRFFE